MTRDQQFLDDHFVVVAVGWYDEESDSLSSVPSNVVLGEN